MQNEPLDGKCQPLSLKLHNTMFEGIEVFYNRPRRHSKINYVSPIAYERELHR